MLCLHHIVLLNCAFEYIDAIMLVMNNADDSTMNLVSIANCILPKISFTKKVFLVYINHYKYYIKRKAVINLKL